MRSLDFSRKTVAWEELPTWRKNLRSQGKSLVVTNGCFDLLHAGHVRYLQSAGVLGDFLLVGVNSDQGVRELKGPSRPLNSEQDRASVLSALESVSFTCVFPGKSAADFLEFAQPDIYVKGGDYTLETLNQLERSIVERHGGKIVFIPFLEGRSTTKIIEKMNS